MYITALLMIVTFICMIIYKYDNTRTFKPFNLETTLPLRGLLAILIVCHHVSQNEIGMIPHVSWFFTAIGAQIVAVFFLMSGYGLFVSYSKKGERYLDGFLGKRYSKILPVFIVLSIFCIVLKLYFGKALTDQFITYAHGQTPLPHSWFIYAIIYIYAAFYISAKIGKNLIQTGLIFLGFNILYVIITNYILHFASYWYWTIVATSAGYFIGYYEKEIENYARRKLIILFGGVIAGLFISFCCMVKIPQLETLFSELWFVAQAVSVYLIIRCLGMVNWRIFNWIGVFSLEVYLIHGILIIFARELLSPVGLVGVPFYLVVIICSIISAFGLHKLVERQSISNLLFQKQINEHSIR